MRGTLKFCALVLYCCYLHVCAGDTARCVPDTIDPQLIVQTEYGKVMGKYEDGSTSMTKRARIFKGIPYAAPVIGENRWNDPKKHDSWKCTLDATERAPACLQPCNPNGLLDCPPEMSEDCLFLNVYTPSTATKKSKLPVLVFIYGGAFLAGDSAHELYDGSYLATHSEIIVVTFNYRLGALGFLVYNDGTEEIAGNFGIKDQRFALEWVKDNIASFGGDATRVTISGESAGAMSVAIHMTNKNPNFHQAILQSDPFAIYYNNIEERLPKSNAFTLLFFLECGLPSSIECLRKQSADDILQKQSQFLPLATVVGTLLQGIWSNALIFGPVIDGDVITEQPLEVFKEGRSAKVPTIMGTNTADALLFLKPASHLLTSDCYYEFLMKLLYGSDGDIPTAAIQTYPPVGQTDEFRLFQMSRSLTDYMFLCPTTTAAQNLAVAGAAADPPVSVYTYIFDYHYSKPKPKVGTCLPPHSAVDSLCLGLACHGAELEYTFHSLEDLYDDDGYERKLADVVSQYWGNFVNTGDPNSSGKICDAGSDCPSIAEWPKYSESDPVGWQSLMIGPAGTSGIELYYRNRFCEVMNQYMAGNDVDDFYKGLATAGVLN